MKTGSEKGKYDRKEELPSSDFRIINWISTISQLSDTTMRQYLDGTDVPPPQYFILNHFNHQPDAHKTVSSVAWAMQQPQPGITKTIAKLLAKGFPRAEDNPADGRSKFLFVTAGGIEAHAEAREWLEAALSPTIEGRRDWANTDRVAFLHRQPN